VHSAAAAVMRAIEMRLIGAEGVRP
jgi:hypothetical protein